LDAARDLLQLTEQALQIRLDMRAGRPVLWRTGKLYA
jgi:hypothetical protein